MGAEMASPAGMAAGPVFLSYASEDAVAARRICDALRAAGIEVWFDQSELRGGDAWDRQIRKQIHDCALFVPVISAHSDARHEGYFRREWRLAVERAGDMSERVAFLVPVVIDDTSDSRADVPDRFREVQWTRLPSGETARPFIERVRRLLSPEAPTTRATTTTAPPSGPTTADTSTKPVSPPMSSKFALWTMSVVLAVAVSYFVVDRFWLSKRTAAATAPAASASPSAPEKSIAVLPFIDLSEKHDQEYFADGMVEEIIDLLAKVPDLRVPARTSSFYFKGKSTKVPDIARELSVANVLEGSIRASGNRLRVTAQLIRADTGFHIWSQTYDGDLHDVFKVQDEIANAVVQALQITLMGGPLTRREGGTQNLEAYQLYLRALASSQSNSRPDLEEAGGYLDQAVKLDPNFALAWTAQASNITGLAWARALPWDEAFDRGRRLAQHALELAPELASGHQMLGYVYRTHDWNWAAAQDEAQRALRSNQRYPQALLLAGQIATTLGRWDEAERYMRAALNEDPLNTYLIWNFATTLYRAGRYADAESWYERVIQKAPKFEWSHEYLAKTLLADGKPELALAQIQLEPTEGERLAILPMALHAVGRESEANAALQSLIQKFADTDAFWIAANYAYRNDRARALQWLNRAYEQREAKVAIEIVGESLFKNVADDPAYKALLRKLNLPE
jgi:TolB-like protein/tetratricopeptide (TPR) repeat protein